MGLAACSQASAQEVTIEPRIEVQQTTAVGVGGQEADQFELEILPEVKMRLPDGWSSTIAVRFEATEGDAGLGTRQTFSSHSRPLKLGDNARVEIDKAVLSWRKGRTRLKFGKQTFAWGVLDGLQVTDRLDPSRKHQAIFIDNRPDRISRWGVRAEFNALGVRWDAAGVFDGTADQLAELGDPFAVSAPRFLSGQPSGTVLPALSFDVSNAVTYGLQAIVPMGAVEIGILGFQGPETEPVYELDPAGVTLTYPTRGLVGANLQFGSGAQVWRAEFAWVPDQPVNTSGGALSVDRRNRFLGGIGLDWTMKGGVFLNAQFGMDTITGSNLVRPNTDLISTIRIQKSWANDTITGRMEVITTLSDGDGTARPSISWRASDSLMIEAGLDYIWGTRNGLIGQFRERDRIWLRLRWVR